MVIDLPAAADTEALGARFAVVLGAGGLLALRGDLGAGKTTFTRGLLRALGVTGAVRSPSYTLVEPYELADRPAYHLDLYRLGDEEEIEYLGLRELDTPGALILVEWPERAPALLAAADLVLDFEHLADGRRVAVSAGTERGEAALARVRRSGDG